MKNKTPTPEDYEVSKLSFEEITKLRKAAKLNELSKLSKCQNKENCGFWQYIFKLLKLS